MGPERYIHGGKVTLINFVLNALPIYLLSFFRIPQRIVQKLISLQRKFLWGGDNTHNKIPWVKWADICLPKNEGGLGIKDISKFNVALMGRWIWAFASGQQQLWVRVLISKYGGWPEFQHDTDKRGFSHWWRDLRKIFHQSDHNIFKHQLTWKVGCGETIKFWTDKWLGKDYTLEQKYNQLFLISRQQNSFISNIGEFNHDSWEWNFRWRRNLFDHESDLAALPIYLLSFFKIPKKVVHKVVSIPHLVLVKWNGERIPSSDFCSAKKKKNHASIFENLKYE